MAAIIQNTTATKGRNRKHDLHIDFTPMVDLGFLLITFFMLTTTLNSYCQLTISLPADGKHVSAPTPIKASQAFTLIMSSNDKILWYEGESADKMMSTDFSKNGIAKILNEKSIAANPSLDSINYYQQIYNCNKISKDEMQKHINHFANDSRNIFVFIKATSDARYQNLISTIDALNKNNIRHYAIADLNEMEQKNISILK